MIQAALHDGRNMIRRRFRATDRYDLLPSDKNGLIAESVVPPERDGMSSDSITHSTERLQPEHLNRDALAFGMICSGAREIRSNEYLLLASILTDMKVRVDDFDRHDMFAHGTFRDHNGRELGMSALRDGAGGVAFHIYELEKTPNEKGHLHIIHTIMSAL